MSKISQYYKKIVIIGLLLILILMPISSAISSGSLLWSNMIGSSTNNVTSVDTDELGNFVYAGLVNGNVVKYESEGDLVWQTVVNGTIMKVRTISDGSIVMVLNSINQTYCINGTDGTIIGMIYNRSMATNISDAGISRDGKYIGVIGNTSLIIYNCNGTIYASNFTFQAESWNKIAYDPYNQFIIATNGLNKTFKWNISTYTGWPEMNSVRDTRNTSNIINDGFLNKMSLVLPPSFNNQYNLSFTNNTSIVNYPGIVQIQNTAFWYNKSIISNFSIRDTQSLVTVADKSNNNFIQTLNFSIVSGHPNITLYYGNTSYKATFANGSML
jgi:hypothetical protein